ncbi:hypothetical protein [uncultured Maribacter sp.]|uniref:hypothetical protein n=1 Tax=uncultured Maribacter sp. TaxID=431308 RepID=UPI00260BB490|nr:hypothetical protein [uncultured Maribacter sp.]
MNVLVFKTNLSSPPLIEWITPYFNSHPFIIEWSVDTEDIDNVLRVLSSKLLEKDVIQLMQNNGFLCEVLPD